MHESDASHQIIADLLAIETGQQLTESRRWRVSSALSGLFREQGISNVDQLVCLLDEKRDASLSRKVVEALLNNETYFFRDKLTFNQIPDNILPELAESRKSSKRLSIWCAGCSTGQEAYSIAMTLVDNAIAWEGWTIEILGTDISQGAICHAREGTYSQFEVQRGLSVTEMLTHFEETQGKWRITSSAREFIEFREHNILSEPPSLRCYDLILCRNVLLYFGQEIRKLAFDRLHSALAHDGFLMLGAGETVVGQTQAFAPVSKKPSLYVPA